MEHNLSCRLGSVRAFTKQILCAHDICLIKALIETKNRNELCAILIQIDLIYNATMKHHVGIETVWLPFIELFNKAFLDH